MDELILPIKDDIIKAIENDQLVLPTLPEVALQVREAAVNEDIDIQKLSRVITNDPALSARIIKVANSPLLRASREIEDLKMAVSRLGIDYTANLATGLAMEQMFQATSDIIDKKMRDVWSRSTEVAGISHVLCRHFTKLKPDQATLAGLVHKIGALPILTYAEDNRKLLKDIPMLDKLIEMANPEIGRKILETWDFPDLLKRVPEEHIQFDREVDTVDYADVVLVANLQSYIGTDHPLTHMDWSAISAFDRLGLSHEVNSHEVEDLSEEMKAAMALLQ
ncbi:MAG: HDOD domain-containing protein [Oceanicoccus sp.]|uniref:HDOD domain-containing protein n=1 Tax=Oceanicoccus sp. TaxID=2691044 RepID=UPI00262BAB63|nr:HDOD domain-containing protein [Oceanicoccus sp.]MDG1771869.1 HDOD domain-containing protein [Oceanicoccus sp.]